MTALEKLPPVKLVSTVTAVRRGGAEIAYVTVANPSSSLGFFIHLQVKQGSAEVLPVLWQDNYFSLMPGEKREVTAIFKINDLHKTAPVVVVEGWNVARSVIPLIRKAGRPQLRYPKGI
jgi:exo-1,4-beta-D-glucosaminidase